uniref:Uncharacterized protein n=1 Tax=Acrobeloides nanus TaxID=290746 RepID=A0A914DS04_9BILA
MKNSKNLYSKALIKEVGVLLKRVPLSMTKRGKLTRDFSIQEDEDQDSIIPNVSLQPYQKPVHKPIGTEHTSVNNQESNYDILEDPQVVNKEEEEEIDETELAERIYKKLKKRIKKEKSSFSFDSSDSGMDMPQATNKYFWKELLFGHRIRRWVFWSVVAFLSALTLKDVYDLVAEYNEDPKQADMKIVFNKSIAMPNITFCMSRAQAWSHFHINGSEAVEEWDESIKDKLAALPDKNTFLNTKWDFRMTLEAYEVISTLTSIERETSTGGLIRSINRFRVKKSLATKRRLIKFWISEIKRRGVSFEELIQKVGKETLDNSIRKFERIANDTEKMITNLRISWLSTTQLCFQPWFNHKSFKPIEDQGSFFTMIAEHSVNKLEGMQVDCMSVDFHGRPSSLSRFMESEGRIRDGYNDELCLGMMHEVKVEIRARYQMLENNDDGTACRNNEGSINSEFNCRSRCRMELLREVCRCTALSLSYLVNERELDKYPLCDYETCFATLNGANFSETNCSKNCFPDCNQIRYDVDHKVKGRSAKSELTTVNLNWGSFEYWEVKHKHQENSTNMHA